MIPGAFNTGLRFQLAPERHRISPHLFRIRRRNIRHRRRRRLRRPLGRLPKSKGCSHPMRMCRPVLQCLHRRRRRCRLRVGLIVVRVVAAQVVIESKIRKQFIKF